MIWRSNDNASLRIYTTTDGRDAPRIYTLLHDAQYRVAIAWQNTAYNQPPHPSFFIGNGMGTPPTPNITLVGNPPPPPPPPGALQAESAVLAGGAGAESGNGGFVGTGYVNFPASGGSVEFRNVDGGSGGNATLRIRFALGAAGTRTGALVVNGASQSLTFDSTGSWTSWTTRDAAVSLGAGTVNTIRLESNGQDLANVDQIEIVAGGPPPSGPVAYEAESALVSGGAGAESINAGFSGSGYVNFPALGGILEFRNVDGGTGGNRTLRVRFALGASGARTGALLVNGVARNVTFNSTLSWTSWATQDIAVSLNAGTVNTVQFQSNGQDLANIDLIEIR